MALQTDDADQVERAGPDGGKRYLGKFPALVRDSFDPEERGRIRAYCPEVMGDIDSEEYWLPWAEADALMAGFDQGLLMVPPDPSWERRDVDAGNSPYNETRVWVEFRDGDSRRPIYSGGGTWLGESDLPHSKPKLSDSNTGGDETTAGPNRTSTTTRIDIEDRTTGATVPGPQVKEVQPGTAAQYPYNHIYKSPAGAIVEFDNTPGGERIRLYHPSGTQWEINESGTLATKVVGLESTFTSGDMQRVVKGGATTIVEGTSHHQYNKSSTWVFSDDVFEIVKKAKRSFITGGWEIQAGGEYKLSAGNIDIESVGAIKLIAGSAVNIGTDDYSVTANKLEISALTSKIQGQARMVVKGIPGVELEAVGSATHPIYASLDINSTWATESAALVAETLLEVPLLILPPGIPVPLTNTPALVKWMEAVTSFAVAMSVAFNTGLTIHRASKL